WIVGCWRSRTSKRFGVSSREKSPPARRYASPMAFKQALAAALQKKARATGESFDRVQQLFLFERFLARLDHAEHSHFVVKGGVALELRLERARTTRDIDLRWAV